MSANHDAHFRSREATIARFTSHPSLRGHTSSTGLDGITRLGFIFACGFVFGIVFHFSFALLH